MSKAIIYEAEQDAGFMDAIAELPEGEAIHSCIQCGTCSATCPVGSLMDHTPRKIFAMMRAGMKQEVLESTTAWTCASCYKCTVDCPQDIKITEIMYALKREAVRLGVTPRDTSGKRFSTVFTQLISKYGRGYELGLMLKQYLFHKPLQLLKQAPVGIEMFTSGKLPLLPHKIKELDGFQKMVRRANELDKRSPDSDSPT